ncbi:hypothetical protein F3N42_06450 [Marinihelvus fidelis]|uniref:Uncharacterized protein n=2 Tax=Marinihelvus fidelis TaxID=2613842 RepID=A0A5N0TE23_9GAMM|nr:hypothetical protein F3N42_06450 [Marinihelvus fidelis]
MRLRRRLTAVATAALLLAAPMAHAMKIKQQNLVDLISDSQNIVHGTVKSVTDGINDKGVPYTEVTISVGSSAKGRKLDGQDVTFRQFGLLKPRTFPNGKTLLAVTPEGFPKWVEGETVVAFLREPASLTGLQTTAGMGQGKFRQVNGKLVNEYANAGLFEGVEIDTALTSPEERNMITQPGAVDAAAFIDLVGRAVEGNWIESGEMK